MKCEIRTDILAALLVEILSPLNHYATQVCFSVHAPTLEQLTRNYVNSGGFERFCASNPTEGSPLPFK
jgi:hypothetical protein